MTDKRLRIRVKCINGYYRAEDDTKGNYTYLLGWVYLLILYPPLKEQLNDETPN